MSMVMMLVITMLIMIHWSLFTTLMTRGTTGIQGETENGSKAKTDTFTGYTAIAAKASFSGCFVTSLICLPWSMTNGHHSHTDETH